jgi:hypothetical protein
LYTKPPAAVVADVLFKEWSAMVWVLRAVEASIVPSTYYFKSAAVFPVGRKGIILQTSEEIGLENKAIDLILKSIVSCIQHCSGR